MEVEISKLQGNDLVVMEHDSEKGSERYCFAYVLIIGRRFHSVVSHNWWGTPDEMQAFKWGIFTGAKAHWTKVSELVYVLCKDGYYRLHCSAQHNCGDEVLRPFKSDTLVGGRYRPDEMPLEEYYDVHKNE